MQRTAEGCGESTIALRALMAMMHLKIAVEVGFVEGIIAATTPRGLTVSMISLVSETTPTVRKLRK